MKAPVWFILARVDFVGGSTGWDRANLIDQCVRHFSSWWLVGTADNDTWGFYTWDLCNQFVAEAVQKIECSYSNSVYCAYHSMFSKNWGRKEDGYQSDTGIPPLDDGVHFVRTYWRIIFGISYFDQMKFWWYVTLAMIPAAAVTVRATALRRSVSERISRP